jgi:hypothetical protein
MLNRMESNVVSIAGHVPKAKRTSVNISPETLAAINTFPFQRGVTTKTLADAIFVWFFEQAGHPVVVPAGTAEVVSKLEESLQAVERSNDGPNTPGAA